MTKEPPGRTSTPRSASGIDPWTGTIRISTLSAIIVLAFSSCSVQEAQQSSEQEDDRPKATGEADELTVVAPENVVGLGEEKTTEDGDVAVEVSYPTIPNAAPLTDSLARITDQEVTDFTAANPGAEKITIGWDLSVAGDDVVAVRLARDEKDSEGERTGYTTYWYDAKSGHTAYSTELLAGQQELDSLDALVKEELKDEGDVGTAELHPIARLYDSMGFNPDGDLVVEFDEGQIAPVESGRVNAVISADDAAPLLSGFGERARAAATVVTTDFQIAKAATAPKGDPSGSNVPGVLQAHGDGPDCSTPESKCVALTFDDGPGSRTPEILDVLAEHDAKATFFVTGEPIREHPTTVRREYADGHEVANHTEHHPDLAGLSADGVREELSAVDALVRRETGYTMDLMRPPYGSTNDTVAEVTEELGQAQIIWDVDTNDWRDRDSGTVAQRAVSGAQPGSIILMHDIHDSTVDAVPSIVERLDEKGYTMVTVSQLLGTTQPGRSYLDGVGQEPEGGADADSDSGTKDGQDDEEDGEKG